MGLALRWGLFCAGRCQPPHAPCSLRSPGLFRGHCNRYCNLSTSGQCWPGFVWTLNPLNQSRPRCWRWLESSLTTCQLGCSLTDAGTRPNVPNHPQPSPTFPNVPNLPRQCPACFAAVFPSGHWPGVDAGIGTAPGPGCFACCSPGCQPATSPL
jgi:hypothetical protein